MSFDNWEFTDRGIYNVCKGSFFLQDWLEPTRCGHTQVNEL